MKKIDFLNQILQTILLLLILVVLFVQKERTIHVNGDKKETKFLAPKVVNIDVSNNPIIGDEDALVDIIIFSDFECPYCLSLYYQLENVHDDYFSTGKAKLIFLNFPLQSHLKANLLAKISEYSFEIGNFYEVYQFLFENQQNIEESNYVDFMSGYFSDTLDFKNYIESPNLAIAEDIKKANEIGVKGTPVFIVNGLMYLGTRSDEEFKKILDNALSIASNNG